MKVSYLNRKMHLLLYVCNIYIYVLTPTNPPSARIVQNPGQIRLFLGNSYTIGSIVSPLFSMTYITRSLPLNLDILLLGVVEPPDWAGENVGPRSGAYRQNMHKKQTLISRVMNANTVVVCIEMGLVGLSEHHSTSPPGHIPQYTSTPSSILSSTLINVYQRLSTPINVHQHPSTFINVHQRPST
jgi:hypothetical protein